MTTLAPENVKKFYKALLLMDKLLYENVLTYKMNEFLVVREITYLTSYLKMMMVAFENPNVYT